MTTGDSISTPRRFVPPSKLRNGIRFGSLAAVADESPAPRIRVGTEGIPFDFACGTDFSGAPFDGAEREATNHRASEQQARVRFRVANNENLVHDVAKGLGVGTNALLGSFDLVLGVNTMRYCHRLDDQGRCVGAGLIFWRMVAFASSLTLNRESPAFRSRIRDRLAKGRNANSLPSLDEYARPFSSAGFEILKKENFCWIPHSAGPGSRPVMKALTPMLTALAPNRAMRSLVISRKVPHRRA